MSYPSFAKQGGSSLHNLSLTRKHCNCIPCPAKEGLHWFVQETMITGGQFWLRLEVHGGVREPVLLNQRRLQCKEHLSVTFVTKQLQTEADLSSKLMQLAGMHFSSLLTHQQRINGNHHPWHNFTSYFEWLLSSNIFTVILLTANFIPSYLQWLEEWNTLLSEVLRKVANMLT